MFNKKTIRHKLKAISVFNMSIVKVLFFFLFFHSAFAQISVDGNNKVGIGIETPDEKLHIDGKLKINQIDGSSTSEDLLVKDGNGVIQSRNLSSIDLSQFNNNITYTSFSIPYADNLGILVPMQNNLSYPNDLIVSKHYLKIGAGEEVFTPSYPSALTQGVYDAGIHMSKHAGKIYFGDNGDGNISGASNAYIGELRVPTSVDPYYNDDSDLLGIHGKQGIIFSTSQKNPYNTPDAKVMEISPSAPNVTDLNHGNIIMNKYGKVDVNSMGEDNKTAATLGKTLSPYVAAFAEDGTLLELEISTLTASEFPSGGAGGQVLTIDGSGNYSWQDDEVDDGDISQTNEIQYLSLSGDDLQLTDNATPVDLSGYNQNIGNTNLSVPAGSTRILAGNSSIMNTSGFGYLGYSATTLQLSGGTSLTLRNSSNLGALNAETANFKLKSPFPGAAEDAIKLWFFDKDTDAVKLSSPNDIVASYNFVLPPTIGTADQILTTDGNGNSSWQDVAPDPNWPMSTSNSISHPTGNVSIGEVVDPSSTHILNINGSMEVGDALGNLNIDCGVETNNAGGSKNYGLGYNVLSSVSTGTQNVGLGYTALSLTTTGQKNTAIGHYSLLVNTTGKNNTATGQSSLQNNSTGFSNCGFGFNALGNIIGGHSNTAIGAFSGPSSSNAGVKFSGAFGAYAIPTANYQIRIGNNSIAQIGGFQPWTNLSDGRFKQNVQEDIPGLNFILALRPVSYEWDIDRLDKFMGVPNKPISESDEEDHKNRMEEKRYTGFIAQEVETLVDEIGYNFNGVNKPQNSNDPYSLSYSSFVVPLVKAVQEQEEVIKDLKAENEALSNKLEDIMLRLEKLEKK